MLVKRQHKRIRDDDQSYEYDEAHVSNDLIKEGIDPILACPQGNKICPSHCFLTHENAAFITFVVLDEHALCRC